MISFDMKLDWNHNLQQVVSNLGLALIKQFTALSLSFCKQQSDIMTSAVHVSKQHIEQPLNKETIKSRISTALPLKINDIQF